MFVVNLLIIFLIVPIILIACSLLLPVIGRLWLLFIICPLALLVFALVRHWRTSAPDSSRKGGGA